jgi:hypothetical protein
MLIGIVYEYFLHLPLQTVICNSVKASKNVQNGSGSYCISLLIYNSTYSTVPKKDPKYLVRLSLSAILS